MHKRPSLLEIIEARKRITPFITRTPLHHYLSLDKLIGAQIYVKHENHQRLGAFKMRGGVNLVAQLTHEQKAHGLIAASTGNHGQAIAYAGSIFDVDAMVVVPENANPDKVDSIRNLGATVVFHGTDFDDAREYVDVIAREEGYRYVHSANEPALIAGAGTYALEILEDLPDTEVIIVPIGGGSGACGTCIVAKSLNPSIQIIGVQAESAPAAYLSWKERQLVESTMSTQAEGLATRVGFELTQSILWDLLDNFLLLSEGELRQAIMLHLEHTHNLAEHAGAAPLGAALKIRELLQGKKVVLVMSGGNISSTQLKETLG